MFGCFDCFKTMSKFPFCKFHNHACHSLLLISGCQGTISCFVCSSRNGSNEGCEDPFNAANQPYIERCKVPKRKHEGEFPAHFCIKLIGTSGETHLYNIYKKHNYSCSFGFHVTQFLCNESES